MFALRKRNQCMGPHLVPPSEVMQGPRVASTPESKIGTATVILGSN